MVVTVPQQPNFVRVSYVIPLPTQSPPRLALPPLGTSRDGSIRPLLVPAPVSTSTYTQNHSDGHSPQPHPRHRLGISSLALDTSTQLVGKSSPEGILYTGGRDGQIIAWELALKTKQRQHRYGYTERIPSWRKNRWEMLTGWTHNDQEIDEEDEEVVGSDGDVLGDVVDSGSKRRQTNEALTEQISHGEAWEYDEEGGSSSVSL